MVAFSKNYPSNSQVQRGGQTKIVELASYPLKKYSAVGGSLCFRKEFAPFVPKKTPKNRFSCPWRNLFAMGIRIGCGSWGDDEYVGLLFPKSLPSGERLTGYARWFDHVEINSSYYRTPRAEATAKWVKQSPKGFLFDIKLHRAFSRNPAKVAAEGNLLDYLREGVEPLRQAGKLGTFLLVLDPSFSPEKHRIQELDLLAEKLKPDTLAVELRHTDWVNAKNRAATLAYFRERGLSWVGVDMPRLKDTSLMPVMDEVTNPKLAYLRLHGRNKGYLKAKSAAERHTYEYPAKELKELAARIGIMAEKAQEVRVVANNHAEDFAPRTALALMRLLGQAVPEPLAAS